MKQRLKDSTGVYYKEISWLLLHGGIGLALVVLRPLSKLYAIGALVFGIWYILKHKNQHQEVLKVAAYLTGLDVFMRMTGGLFFSEQIKYALIIITTLGLFFSGFKIKGIYYVIYLLLLVPGIYMSAVNTLSYDAEFRKIIAFNLSGPFCTGFCALYCMDRKITYKDLKEVLYWLLLPIMAMVVYITFYKVDVSASFRNTTSNFVASGGYGPNQVSVVLGVGMFILLTRFVLYSPLRWLKILYGSLLCYVIYRGLITFSRGGVITALLAAVPFVGLLVLYGQQRLKASLVKLLLLLSGGLVIAWIFANSVSNGLLTHRYNNEDAIGRKKEDALGGREELISYELEAFFENPFLGIGVGNNKFFREDESGVEAASHNEITRLLAEHGLFGILAFLVLLIVPLIRFLNTHKNVFALSFFVFWLLTINHNATRIAMPAFLYGLSLITLYNEKPTVHRKQTVA